MRKGRLFILSGPSGCGKDTIMQLLFARHPEIKLSISSITRPMREGEVEGEKYHFISREEFEDLLQKDMFLEHNVFVGNYYGTPRQPVIDCIESGTDIILEVDVNGADIVRGKVPDAVSIFIMPPSISSLNERLHKRGTETEETIVKRITQAENEIKRADKYDYIVINDNLEKAVDDVISIITSDRLRFERNTNIINEVLK